MLHLKSPKAGLDIFKALSSDIRLEMLHLLAEHSPRNLNELAVLLGLTNGAVTMHIKKLEDSGLIRIETAAGKHGVQKMCFLNADKLLIDLLPGEADQLYEVNIQVGHYSAYEASPTCGLATKDRIIGEFDDPRYFDAPEHVQAEIIWLTHGFLEYRIPNYLKPNQQFTELQFLMELGSEAPSYCNNWPSDIYFYLNDAELGYWTSPGDFGGEKGAANPDWWPLHLNQYGMLKLIRINHDGTFIDGTKVSETSLDALNLDYKSTLKLKLSAPADAKNPNGLTIYGKHFGNYSQDMIARMLYTELPPAPSS
ncbi:ArsR/SmtB family transcription factor [Paenibacillus sp. y28]|uniref:ArsR/SmtB family transcription factor n=1 Tax=Paenibacillus sp. y28 TaxID=3129110 RepID=UPI0030187CED